MEIKKIEHQLSSMEKAFEHYTDPNSGEKRELYGKQFVFRIFTQNKEEVGICKISFFRKPFKFLKIDNIDIYHRSRGNKYGSYIRERIFDFLDKKGIPAALTNISSFSFYSQVNERTGESRQRYWRQFKDGDNRYLYYLPSKSILSEKEKDILFSVVK